MSTRTSRCDACGASVTYSGHRGFKDAHTCPKRGTNAIDVDHGGCPTHGTLVWMVGPYSTYRQCAAHFCTAGVNSKGQPNGKPWRYCAPRGESRAANDSSVMPSAEAAALLDNRTLAESIRTINERATDTEQTTSTPSTKPATPEDDTAMATAAPVPPQAQQALNALIAALQPAPAVDMAEVERMIDAVAEGLAGVNPAEVAGRPGAGQSPLSEAQAVRAFRR